MEVVTKQVPRVTNPGHASGVDASERSCIISIEHIRGDGIKADDSGQKYVGTLVISGWVVCRDLIERLAFEYQGSVLGMAAIGTDRPDVAAAYPAYPNADQAGFSAVLSNVRLVNGALPELTTSVWTRGGKRYGGRLGLPSSRAALSAPDQTPQLPTTPHLPLEGTVDLATIDTNGRLLVGGWAIGSTEIVAVQVVAGNTSMGLATTGLEREDVAASFPAYPNARNGGFRFESVLSEAQRAALKGVQVEVIGRNGEVRTIPVELARVPADGRSKVSAPPADDPVRSSIQSSCDLAEVTPGGQGVLSGWAVSPHGIRSVRAVVDDVIVGEARLGLTREDVAAVFPAIPDASRSGYAIRFDLNRAVQGGDQAILRIEDKQAGVLELSVDLQLKDVLSIGPAQQAPLPQGSPDDFRFYLDSPAIRGQMVIDPITGAVTVAGWAIARHGLASVAIAFGETPVGNARLGSRRPDIGTLFPDWPDALMSGFGLFVPAGMLKNGPQNLTLVLTDKRGIRRTEHIQVDVQKTPDGEGDRPLRRKVSVLETDTHARIVQSAGAAPDFHCVLSISDEVQVRELLPITLRSLVSQTYKAWRLTILLAGPKNGGKLMRHVRAVLAPDTAARVRLQVISPRGPADWFFEQAGEVDSRHPYVVHLQAGDELAVDALMQVALSNVGVTFSDFIYGDERRESPVLGRVLPFLKPGWSPELLLSTNYIGRFWLATPALLAGAFSSMAEFAQASDYERVLRLTERAKGIRRVPKVLSERHAKQQEDKKLELDALRGAALRRGIAATIEESPVEGTYRLHRKLLKPGKVSIIIPSIAARGLIRTCIESIRKSSHGSYEIILIDNIKDAGSEWKPWFRRHADKVIEVLEDFNWSLFNNIGAEHATGDYLLFLNDDIEVLDPHWMETLMEIAQSEDVGVVGPYLLYPDRTVQHAGLFLSGPGTARHAFRFAKEDEPGYFGFALTQRDMIGVTGACMMMRREVFDALGGFDPAHSVINNDLDFCLRCNDVGLSAVYTPYTRLIHHELVSREKLPDHYDTESFAQTWAEVFSRGDPFFHPGLSRCDDYYSMDTEYLREVYAGFPIAHKADLRRIVAFKLDHIGDFITALPAIRRLKERFPTAMLAVVVGPAVAALARTEPVIDEVLEFAFFHARSGLGQKQVTEDDLRGLKSRLEPYQFDLAVDLRKHPDTRHVLQYSGAKLLAGFDRANMFPWLDVALEWEGDPTWVNKRQHVAGDLLNLVDAISNGCEEGRDIMRRTPGGSLRLPPAVAKMARQLYRKPVIGVHPASGNQLRQWPVEHFADLIDLLVTRLPVHVAIIGGPDEADLADAVLARLKNKAAVWSLVGLHKLSELPDVLQSLALFVGNNSGPKHVAAGLGVPTVAVHSAVVSTEEWGPLGRNAVAIRKDMNCAPCYRAALEDCHRNLACMRDITPEHVYGLCLRFLALAGQEVLGDVGQACADAVCCLS
jgi:ADP-heptose:LPS heptosyltransferase/GT2 family glycosyltransferase